MDYALAIKSFLEDRFLVTFDEYITEDTDLFKAGVIESEGYLNILKFLQEDLDIEMTDEDLFLNVFVSLSSIIDFIEAKKVNS